MVSAQFPRFRPILDQFAPYKPGQTSWGPDGRSFKLSSNESPFGPLPSVAKVIAEAAGQINRYPDNGAVELIEAVGEPGAEVLYAGRSFESYPTLSDLAGATSVRVPLRDEAHDLAAMADAITRRTRLIFVCNPNNPT